MSDQLQLVAIPADPKLTPRQEDALTIVRQAGQDGIHADELGRYGRSVLIELRRKGAVRMRRGDGREVWQAANLPAKPANDPRPDVVPYNEFPAGY